MNISGQVKEDNYEAHKGLFSGKLEITTFLQTNISSFNPYPAVQ